MYPEATAALWGSSYFLILSGIQFPEMLRLEQLGKNVLSYAYEKKEWDWEQYSSYRYPSYSKANQEINELEDCKCRNILEWYCLHK